MDPPEGVTVVPYDDVASTLNTGDLILFSGVTSTGAVIKVFDDARFSHVAIVSYIAESILLRFMLRCSKGHKVQAHQGIEVMGSHY